MSREEARDHVRAAQEAEIAGNRAGAVGHLERAALAFVRTGQMARAAQMYQHALRLAPDRQDLREAMAKAESWAAKKSAEASPPTVEPSPDLAQALDEATRSNEHPGLPNGVSTADFQRGPTRAPADVDAWCSFCCRPMRETGPLAQGPAGAYICASCLQTSAELLRAILPAAEAPAAPAAPKSERQPAEAGAKGSEASSWVGPRALLELGRAALSGRGGSLVFVGQAGVGKTALLSALAAEFPAAARVDLARGDALPGGEEPVLLDHLEVGGARWAALEGRPFVAALRAEFEPRPLRVQANAEVTDLPLAEVELPPGFPRVPALALPPADEAGSGLDLAAPLREALVARALQGGRGAHDLVAEVALLRGLARGAPLEHAGEVKRPRRRRA
jgi:hypothetical protein